MLNRVFDFISETARATAHGHADLRPTRHPRELPDDAGIWLNDEELARLANLGNNGPRDVGGGVMTHCVPKGQAAVADQPDLVVSD